MTHSLQYHILCTAMQEDPDMKHTATTTHHLMDMPETTVTAMEIMIMNMMMEKTQSQIRALRVIAM